MNVSASGLSKILLQVTPRDFSKFAPFFSDRVRLYRIHFSVAAQAEMAGATYSGQLHRAGLWCLRNYGYGPG